ncbi:Flavinator of succinate dehydrogenase [Aquimixticola soesokkakensis]|uniref:FAD assembly factor SdhE n=1 Tax=Aquimixticola soesokkakensis TaxID=1519096 RepID=A0A1Y5SWP5_9RHOB|nr:succinate dehydrogenase assembly factor 2 [Aquimixticola soesokkakensis]SLN49771.1 Flavinator of succinate dehydrogenase [Aquimixticola soesokkakensis]
MTTETTETRVKRLKIRAWRRGIKEMDLVIGGYADAHLATMSPAELDEFETAMNEHDQDLLSWMTGQSEMPAELAPMLTKLKNFAVTTTSGTPRGA